MLSDTKMKISVAELGHNGRLKIYVDPSKSYFDPDFLVHLNGLFSESTVLMVLNFHMLHDQTLGLQNDKIPLGRESKWLPMLKIAKLIKINFSPEWHGVFG